MVGFCVYCGETWTRAYEEGLGETTMHYESETRDVPRFTWMMESCDHRCLGMPATFPSRLLFR